MLKRILPHLSAVVVFSLLTIIYFMPVYQDMMLNQGDITQWEGMSKEVSDWNKAHPDDPAFWTDRMFGGMPTVQVFMTFPGNLAHKIFEAVQLIFLYPCTSIFIMYLGFYILLLCLEVDPWLSIAGAVAFGLSSFTFVSLEAGHNTKVIAMSMMSPILGGMILAYRKNILIGAAIVALFLSLAIDANHLQITYYTLLMVGIIGVYFLVIGILQKKITHFVKASGMLLVAAMLAALPNLGLLWSVKEYVKETIRGGASELSAKKIATKGGGLDFDYATRWSEGSLFYKKYTLRSNNGGSDRVYGPGEEETAYSMLDSLNKKSPGAYELKTERSLDGEFLTILIPNMKGGASGAALDDGSYTYKEMLNKGVPENTAQQYLRQMPLYWGSQPFTSGPVYFGAAIVFLALFSLLIIRNPIKWVLLFLTVFSVLLACGHNTPFFGWMFNLLPFFNKFRTPTMAFVIAQLAVPLLALLGLNEVLTGEIKQDELLKKLKIALGITGGIVILFGLLGGMFFNFSADGDKQYYDNNNGWLIDALKKDRASLLRDDALRSLFFIAASFGLIWFYLRKTITRQIFIGVFIVLFLIDGWMIDKRYLNADSFVEKERYENNHARTRADEEILKDPDPDYRVFNTTRDPFNDAMTSYWHKSVGGYHPAKLIRYQDLIENQISKYNMNVFNMLNTKYFIVQDKQQRSEPVVQRNPGALGNAWFVKEIKWVKNADEEMAALTNFDPKTTVVIDERFKKMVPDVATGGDSTGLIRLMQYSPNIMKYASKSTSSQLTVFSEIYYDDEKGWHAFIDGKPAEHFRVNYVLRAMVIPAGTHEIEFRIAPKSYTLGNKLDYAGSFLLLAFVFGTLGFAGYRKMKEIEAQLKTEPKPAPAPPLKPGKKK